MDALSFDYMLPEYQDKTKDAEVERLNSQEESSPSSPPSNPSRESVEETFDYEEEVGGVETVEVSQLVPETPEAAPKDAVPMTNGSTSSSNNSIQENNSIGGGSQSFYIPSVMSPSISYERDFPAQKLIAVFGRQFDRPDVISHRLQRLVSTENEPNPSAKFLPFTMKREALMKGIYSSAELKKHNLICMCYNASEARILLTGVDGFYSSLLRHIEAVLGGC